MLPLVASGLSSEQTLEYARRTRILSKDGSFPPATFATLELLIHRHHATFVFENLGIHYEKDHVADISLQGIYDRFLNQNKGGYCMQHNLLLLNMLRALSYRCYTCAARVFAPHDDDKTRTTSFSHQVIIVQCKEDHGNDGLYLADVGFGSTCPQKPVPLIEGAAVDGLYGEEHRISKRRMPGSAFAALDKEHEEETNDAVKAELANIYAAQTFWILEQRRHKDSDFNPQYSIALTEFTPKDFDVMNYHTYRKSELFSNSIVVVRTYKQPDTEDDCDPGKFIQLTLFNKRFSRRQNGQATVLKENIESDKERIDILREHFGLDLNKDEALEAIKESVAQI